jgi:hypothetical protein
MVGQERAVEFGPFYQIPFLMVVRDEGDLFIMFHRDFFVSHTLPLILCIISIMVNSFSLVLWMDAMPGPYRPCGPLASTAARGCAPLWTIVSVLSCLSCLPLVSTP